MPEESCLLTVATRAHPDAPAALSAQGTLTYREYDALAHAHAQRLRDSGLAPGAVLGIRAPRSVEWLPLLMGCFRAGVVALPINTRLPQEAVETLLKSCHLQTCLGVLEVQRDREHFPPCPPAGGGDRLGNVNAAPSWSPPPAGGQGGKLLAVPEAPSNEFGGGMNAGVWGDLVTDAPAVYLQTSGSTGKPKIAVLSYGNLRANAEASNRNIPLTPGDVWLLSLPLYHVSGLGVLFRCLAAGATVAVPDESEDLIESIERYHVTHVSLVTTQLYRLLEQPSAVHALKNLKAILLGGSAMPPQLIRQALDLGLPIHASYGLTEAASQVATTTPSDRTEESLRRAKPLVPGSVRISPGGEIELSGPTLFLGYKEDNAVHRPATPDGWFPTGDLGSLDSDGRLTVLGRKDNLFISGGENIQPEEIERELCAIKGVEAAVVVPVEDPEFGHRPVAFIKPDQDPAPLREALKGSLPAYKVPIAFHPWPKDLPGLKPPRQAFKTAAQRRSG